MSRRTLSVFVTVLLIASILLPIFTQPAYAAWYDSGWLYRKSITIDHTKVAATLTDFPVLISISGDSDLASHARADGYDILFTAGDGSTLLSHERESYSSGTLVAWVNVPSLSFSADTVLYVYYGNSGHSSDDLQNKAGVWPSGSYMMVQHLDVASNPRPDSTSHANNGAASATGVSHVTGQIVGADRGDGAIGATNGIVTINDNLVDGSLDFGSSTSFSYTLWFKSEKSGLGVTEYIVDKKSGTLGGAGAGYMFGQSSDSALCFSANIADGTNYARVNTNTGTPGWGNNQWTMATVVVDRTATTMYVYINGVLRNSGSIGSVGNIDSTWNLILLGRPDDSGSRFQGAVDEIRIERRVLSADWISASYNSMNSPGTFYSLGSEEENTPTTHTITASAGAGGSILPSGAVSVDDGEDQAFTITPDSGYAISDVLVDGGSVGAVTSYTFYDVIADHSIAASFAALPPNVVTLNAISPQYYERGDTVSYSGTLTIGGSPAPDGTVVGITVKDHLGVEILVDQLTTVGGAFSSNFVIGSSGAEGLWTIYAKYSDAQDSETFYLGIYTITASAAAGGSILPSGAVSVNYGASQGFAITPSTGYDILDVLVDGGSVGPQSSYTFNNVQADHTIAASFAMNVYHIDASAGSGGSISPSGSVPVNHGADQTFTITPDANYHILDVLVDGSSVGPVSSYPFTAVTADHTIAASFAIDTHTITASAGDHGSISPSGAVTVNHGADQLFSFTPDPGYHVADVLVDGGSIGAPSSHTFLNVQAAHTISVTFAINVHTITASAGVGGSISPSGSVNVNDGADQEFTIAANTGYHIVDVVVDSVSKGPISSWTFTAVHENHEISANFAIDTFIITASAGDHGSISPSGAVSVNYGADQAFTINPDIGYHILDVLVDGSSIGPQSSHTFTNVQADHTIAASFAIDTFTITASAGAGGSILPSGAVTVDYGADQGFTITADAYYHILDVLVDGSSVGAVPTHTFTNVQTTHTITASFLLDAPVVTVTGAYHGARLSWSGVGVASYDIYYNLVNDPDTATQYATGISGTTHDVTGLPENTWDGTCYYWVAPAGSTKASWGMGSDKVWAYKVEITSVVVDRAVPGNIKVSVAFKSRYLEGPVTVQLEIGEYLGPGIVGNVPNRPMTILTTGPVTLTAFLSTGGFQFETASNGEVVSGSSYKAWIFLWNMLPSEPGYWEAYSAKYEVIPITIP